MFDIFDRVKCLMIPEDMMVHVMTGHITFIKTLRYALPDDAHVMGVFYRDDYRAFAVYIASETYELVHPTAQVPVINVDCESIEWHEDGGGSSA